MNTQLARPPMSFWHEDGLVPAWQQAKTYAGKDGRIATLPDILEARLHPEATTLPWNRYFTTSSAEYFGIGRDRHLVLIVAHGIGPMTTLEGIKKAYSWEYADKQRNRRGGRISQEEFWKLEAGEYGEVSVIPFGKYMHFLLDDDYYPFDQKRAFDCLKDELLRARLGPHGAEYVQRHLELSQEWRAERGLSTNDEDFTNPFIISHHDASNSGYPLDQRWLDWFKKSSPDMAMGHLLSIGSLVWTSHERHESLLSDVRCHEWGDGVRFLAIPAGNSPSTPVSEGPDPYKLVRKHWKKLMMPVTEEIPDIGMRALVKVKKEWFTEYPKAGARMDTHEPEFHVLTCAKVGKPTIFRTSAGGGFFFKFDLEEVVRIAPPGANAYRFVGEVDRNDNDWVMSTTIQFYRVTVDLSQRLKRQAQLGREFDTMLELMNSEK